MRKRDDFDVVAERHAGALLDNACPHGGGGSMRHECQMCVLAALRGAAREGAKAAEGRSWKRHVRRTLMKAGGPP
jgi:hypothetical protein